MKTDNKLIPYLFNLLEKTNKKFTEKWKFCQTSNQTCSFKECSESYQMIIELVRDNQREDTNYLLESYYLEARLGRIQSNFNDLPQNPPDEDVLANNDKKIEALTESIEYLMIEATMFKLHTQNITNPALLKDYIDLFNKINASFNSWDETINQRKAAYYYNLAEKLVKESKEIFVKNVYDFDLKKNLLSTSIACLGAAHDFYKKGSQQQSAIQTADYQKKIEKQFATLAKSLQPTVKIKRLTVPKKYPPLDSLPKTFIESHSTEEKQTELNNKDLFTRPINTLPLKKRKIWDNWDNWDNKEDIWHKNSTIVHLKVKEIIKETLDVGTRKKSYASPFKIDGIKRKNLFEENEPVQKKSYISPGDGNANTSILLKTEEEKIHQKEEDLKKMLSHLSTDNPFRFYGKLFLELSQQLEFFYKENSNHALLTQLSWLTSAHQLINLISDKNQRDSTILDEISNIIKSIKTKHNKNLAIISYQKRGEAFPSYDSQAFQSKNLQNLLTQEIFDFYYGLEAFRLTSAATFFLDLIPNVVKKHNFSYLFEEIKNVIQSAQKQNENLFCAELLRELVKFYIFDKNSDWINSCFLPKKKLDLGKEYLRILIISERFSDAYLNKKSQELKNKIQKLREHLIQQLPGLTPPENTISGSSFFQLYKQTESSPSSPIELLIETLREHFQCIVTYKVPNIASEAIYKNLLLFIQTHCEEKNESLLQMETPSRQFLLKY